MSRAWFQLSRRMAHALVLAMLLAALAPALSRALAAWRAPAQGGWVQVCSNLGMQWVQLGGDADAVQRAPRQPAPAAMDLCGLCCLAAERFAPLIPCVPAVDVLTARWPPPLFAWRAWGSRAAPSPSARGPPHLC